jgi:probable F420-dependent oxidoreductase
VTQRWRNHLGQFGIWRGVSQVTPDLAAAVERLGFGALWVGGSPGADLVIVEELLDATSTLVLATGIVNIWQSDAVQVAASFARLQARHPGRFLLGVGAGHAEAVQQYARPHQALTAYVDVLLGNGVPASSLVLAALGPKMLRLAAERTAGAHPYLVTPEFTRQARAILGSGPLLAPEHKAVLETDPTAARAIGRPRVHSRYLRLVNYTNNLRRLGWTEQDLSDGGSDELIDALVARGSAADVAARLREHLEAGANHVCAQLLTEPDADPLVGYQQLARALALRSP